MKTILTSRLAFTPHEAIERPVIVVNEGVIERVSSRSVVAPGNAKLYDFGDAILAPGFIDIHVHGGAGHDVMQDDLDSRARMERHFAKHGVTSYCATTVTAPLDKTYAALERLGSDVDKNGSSDRARLIGLHLEGPFISRAKRGVHPPADLIEPSVELFEKFWQAAHGKVSVLTIAPELNGALEVIKLAASRNVCISLGHSNATLDESQMAIDAGARHATHTFNAMRPLDHREPGVLGAVLADSRVTADIIADGIHVHPEMVSLFLRAKGPDKAILITDAISATGMGDGRYMLGGFEVEVKGDRCEYEGKLAGSVLTLDRAVRNVAEFAHWPLQQSIRLATANPAAVIGRHDIGVLKPGAKADLVVLSPKGEVQRTIINGHFD